jgi:hypothetical protein
MRPSDIRTVAAVLGLLAFLLPACSRPSDRTRFNTPDDAAKALLPALETNNTTELKAIFGPTAEQDLSSGDPVSDRHDRQVIALAMRQSWKWVPSGTDRSELVIGDEQWPLPIPLVKAGNGWEFDTDAGKDEMLSRRIGRNELRVIDLCRAYVLMQQEYASQPRDGKPAGLYARKLRSEPGRHDGLYWEVGPKERRSPMGDLVAKATTEGYDGSRSASTPFYGYYFRVLTAQGAAAKGGARDYVVNGEMSGGFGLIAYPAEYGRSGIMTFMVIQDGVVYESDLGEETAKTAPGLNVFNPDAAWAEVKVPASQGRAGQ